MESHVPEVNTYDALLIYIVGRVDQGIRQEMRLRLADWDLSVPEFTALAVLKRRPGLSNAQLARRSLVRPQSMNEILVKLEARGLLRREVDPDHARILRAALTTEGVEVLAAAEPAVKAIQDELFAEVPESQRQVMIDGLRSAMEKLRSSRRGDAGRPPAGEASERRMLAVPNRR
ncbi:MAG TPA: MarR family transcriptional regulator [Solirubrobacteraceae bacterium]|nr:MarR family transcriptional regulator [Solirubrobacteraceae bacterium]